jgi:predicted cupin superfamily sugar epimerase
VKTAEFWIKQLELLKHPEGGFYKETYRADEIISKNELPARYTGARNFSTAIYYLLQASDFSAFHRIKSDETWHFYQGTGLELFEINQRGNLTRTLLGADLQAGMRLQHTVLAGNWFAARIFENKGFALMGCTVAPGFDFEDFEMADSDELKNKFPSHQEIISQLAR